MVTDILAAEVGRIDHVAQEHGRHALLAETQRRLWPGDETRLGFAEEFRRTGEIEGCQAGGHFVGRAVGDHRIEPAVGVGFHAQWLEEHLGMTVCAAQFEELRREMGLAHAVVVEEIIREVVHGIASHQRFRFTPTKSIGGFNAWVAQKHGAFAARVFWKRLAGGWREHRLVLADGKTIHQQFTVGGKME